MVDLLLVVAVLTGLPVATQAARIAMELFARLLATAFVMAVGMVLLLVLATHGKLA